MEKFLKKADEFAGWLLRLAIPAGIVWTLLNWDRVGPVLKIVFRPVGW